MTAVPSSMQQSWQHRNSSTDDSNMHVILTYFNIYAFFLMHRFTMPFSATMNAGGVEAGPAWMQGVVQMDQKQDSPYYEAPKAEVVEVTGTARCLGTSVPISSDPWDGDISDIG